MRALRVVSVPSLFLAAACPASDASYSCATADDCPADLVCVVAVCAPAPAALPDGGGGDDAGSSATDAGLLDDDGGQVEDDAGDGDAGHLVDDAGAGPEDAGTSPPDAGPLAECGNGAVEDGEACDDDNVAERDGCSSACRAWWDEAFPVRLRIELRSPAGAAVDAPVGLVLPRGAFPTSAPLDRACVVAGDQRTVLPLEVERAATATDDALVWTRLLLPAGDSELFVYFGDDVVCSGTQAQVWAGYAGVFHFESTVDSTASVPLAGAGAGFTRAQDGRRGAAANVTPGGWAQVTPPGALWITGSVTLEAWGRLSAFGSESDWENTLFQAAGGGAAQAYFLNVENSGRLRAYWESSNFDGQSTATFPLALDAWHHYVMVRNNAAGTVRFFVDGVPLGEGLAFTGPPTDAPAGSSYIYLGGNFTRVGRRFTGTLDEVRVVSSALSADAVAISHAGTSGALVVATTREPAL